MFRFGSILWRVLLIVFILGGLAFGGFTLYRLGAAQGYAAAAQSDDGAPAPDQVMPFYRGYPGYGYGMPYHHFGFFFPPFFGLLCLFGLLPLFFFGMARMFFRPYWYRHGPHGWDGGPWDPPPWMKEEGKGEEKPEADSKEK